MKLLYLVLRPFLWLSRRDPGLFETISGIAALGWGLLALQYFPPPDEPASLGVYATYHIQRPVAVLLIILGIGQLKLFDLIDCNWREHWLRWWGSLLLMTHWFILCGSSIFMGGLPVAPGTFAIAAIGIGNFALCCRIIGWDRLSGSAFREYG